MNRIAFQISLVAAFSIMVYVFSDGVEYATPEHASELHGAGYCIGYEVFYNDGDDCDRVNGIWTCLATDFYGVGNKWNGPELLDVPCGPGCSEEARTIVDDCSTQWGT